MQNSNLKWTDDHIKELKTIACHLEPYMVYSLYCTALDEIARLVKEDELDYDDMRKFQEKFIKADSTLTSIKDALEEYK